MRRFNPVLLCILLMSCSFFLLPHHSKAGEKLFTMDSGDSMKKAMEYHDAGSYKEAIAIYRHIPENDTNYLWAQYELCLSALLDQQLDLAKSTAKAALQVKPNPYEHDLLIQLGSTYDEAKQYDSAARVFGNAIERFPNSYTTYHARGINLYLQQQYDSAFAYFKKALLINPYAFNTHYYLGLMCGTLGYPVHAMMAYGMGLLLSPGGNRAGPSIREMYTLSNMGDKIQQALATRHKPPFITEEYTEIETYFTSRIALEKNYAIQTRLDETIFRQLNMISEKLPSTVAYPDDFWSAFYAPLYKEIFTRKCFEAATAMMVSAIDNEQVKKVLRDSKKEIAIVNDIAIKRLNDLGYHRSLQEPVDLKKPGYIFEDAAPVARGLYLDEDKKQPDGEWEYYNKVGEVRTIIHFHEGKLQGAYTSFHANNKVKSTASFANEKVDGESKEYYENGVLKTSAMLKLGTRDGDYREFHTNGSPALHEYYQNGKRQGKAAVYYPSGSLQYELQYKEDEIVGEVKEYDQVGKLSSVTPVQKGKADGLKIVYHPDGSIEQKCAMKEGERDGQTLSYFRNGQLSSSESYKKGKRDGVCTYYHENGKIRTTITYVNDVQNGPSTLTDEEGRVVMTDDYKNGHIKRMTYYNILNGKVVRENVVDDKEKNTMQVYNAMGNLIKEAICDRDGMYNGEYKEFLLDGRVSKIKSYKKGALNGLATSFYRNGNKHFEETYKEDELHGPYKRYHWNGVLAEEGEYDHGSRQGYWYSYNDLSDLVEKEYYLDGEKHGNNTVYYANGQKRRVMNWNKGDELGFTEYDTSGRSMQQIVFIPGKPNPITEKNGTGLKDREITLVNNFMQGAETIWYPNNKIQSKTWFENGLLDTIKTSYHTNGLKSREGYYVNDELEGAWRNYDRYGNLSSINHYINGESNGIDSFFTDSNHPVLETTIPYKDDERHGWLEKYSYSGELMFKYHYIQGLMVGYTYTLPDGTLSPEIPVENSGKQVALKTFYKNGKLSCEGGYQNGDYEGKRTLYFPDGKIYFETNYLDGENHGEEKEYYPNGQLNTLRHYANGDLEGRQQKFSEKGVLLEEENYHRGFAHGPSKYFDENGKLLQTITYYWGDALRIDE